MPKRLSTEEFIRRAKQIHSDKFNYSEVEYINNTTSVVLFCYAHKNRFLQQPGTFICNGAVNCRPCINEKVKKTTMERYGVENALQSPEIQNKIKQTNLERYGVEHTLQSEEVKEKIKQTNMERYGVEYPSQSAVIREKVKQSNLEHYGVEYVSQSPEIQNKIKQTNMERYGVEHTSQSEEFKEKIKQTNIERYGVENPFQSEEFKEKIKQTNLEKYGVEHALQSPVIQNKIKQTNMERYGVEYVSQLPEVKEKIKQTNLERYGVEHILQSEEFKEKIKQTNLERYGVEYHKQVHINESSLKKLNDKEWIYEQHIIKEKSLMLIGNELGVGDGTVGRYLHGHNIETRIYGTSIGEREVSSFIKSLNIEVISNTRKIIPPYELDIYIPEHNLAIEYCGLYWHSEQAGKDKHYHENKFNRCKALGIQLITIFEDEWFNRQEQVKSKIKSLLHKDDRSKVFARKTQITLVSKKTKLIFYDTNHIQGDGPSSINIGLTYNNKLVACMSFIKSSNDYTLNRYATSCRVTGGFSKLLKYFINEYKPKEIISFADLRWSTGNLYLKTGWEIDKILLPDYSYSPDAKQRFHKFNYRRKNLPKLLNDFNPKLSEKINCDNNGILRIWDCGKIRFKYTP